MISIDRISESLPSGLKVHDSGRTSFLTRAFQLPLRIHPLMSDVIVSIGNGKQRKYSGVMRSIPQSSTSTLEWRSFTLEEKLKLSIS
jgi:hypothetical protein